MSNKCLYTWDQHCGKHRVCKKIVWNVVNYWRIKPYLDTFTRWIWDSFMPSSLLVFNFKVYRFQQEYSCNLKCWRSLGIYLPTWLISLMASSSAFSTSSKNVKILLNEKVTQVISWILISSNKDILQDVLFFRWISNFSCCAVTNFCSSRWLKFLLGNNLQHTLEAAEHSQGKRPYLSKFSPASRQHGRATREMNLGQIFWTPWIWNNIWFPPWGFYLA